MKTPLKVLIIEDSEFDTIMLVNVLRQAGYEPVYKRVETADDMREALAQGGWDLVISDYTMPRFSMWDALEIIKNSSLDIPFLIVSGGIGEDTAVSAMKAGAHDYIMKGNLSRLGPAVARELRDAATRAAKKRAEEALRESELRYRLLWETSTDAVVLLDLSYQIQFASPAVYTVFGYQPAEILGKNVSILHPENKFLTLESDPAPSQNQVIETNETNVSTKKILPWQTIGFRKNGSQIDIEIASSRMELHGKTMLVEFIRDITFRKKIEEELRRTQEQFRLAREIQQRLFPKNAPELPGFDIAGVSYPAEETGGDYYDFLNLFGSGLGIVIGDVTGHGIGPALLMAETRAYLRLLSQYRDDPGDILTRANRILAEDVGSERFVTLFFAKLDPQKSLLSYVNAGHPKGYIFDFAGQVKRILPRTNIPLGFNSDTRYIVSEDIKLEHGDLILLVTDGVEETTSPDNQFFGDSQMLKVVESCRQLPAAEIVRTLFHKAVEFSKGAPRIDDFTAVVVKVL